MSGRTAAALCLAAFFATATAGSRWEWIASAWNALAVEEPSSPSSSTDGEPETGPGWLVDPNG